MEKKSILSTSVVSSITKIMTCKCYLLFSSFNESTIDKALKINYGHTITKCKYDWGPYINPHGPSLGHTILKGGNSTAAKYIMEYIIYIWNII